MSKRDPFFDSLKFILICFVVFGHILESSVVKDQLSIRIYSFIYTFHMPLFIFISGYFSKNMTWEKVKRSAKTLLPAYFIFQTILSVPDIINGSFNIFDYFFSPQNVLWYILALLYWRVLFFLVPKIKKLNFIIVFTSSIIASLLIGLINYPVFLSITKTISFLPYFVLGYYCTGDIITKIRAQNKIISLVVLAATFLLTYLFTTSDFILNLYGDFSYKYVFGDISTGILYRILSIAAAILVSYSIINIAPTKLNKWGNQTLGIYLLHAPLVYIAYRLLLIRYEISPDIFLSVLAFVIIMSLCLLMLRLRVFQYLVNPILLFEKRDK